MAKIKIKPNGYQLMVTAKLSFWEKMDEQKLKFLSRKPLKGLLRVYNIERKKVEYIGLVGIPLSDRLKNPVSKYDFYFMMEQIVNIIQKVNEAGLEAGNLVLNMDNVYINEVTKEIQFVYLPILDKPSGNDTFKFLETFIYSAKPMLENDMEYISRLVFFMSGLEGFELNKIEKFIGKEDIRVVKTVKHNNPVHTSFLTDKPMDYYNYYESDEEETGLLIDDEMTRLLVEDATTSTLVTSNSVKYGTLFRISTKETISIHKPIFRIGKEGNYSDYIVNGNDKVSRSHADIIARGYKHYVVDLNSRNRTYINGQVIAIKEETEILDGDMLRLANEEFIFRT